MQIAAELLKYEEYSFMPCNCSSEELNIFDLAGSRRERDFWTDEGHTGENFLPPPPNYWDYILYDSTKQADIFDMYPP
eukprot:scaffold15461_cov83-Skeletonema_dohrnii-CCMP3373.AAC.4